MELLNRFKQNGYFTAELYNLLAKKKLVENSEEIIPSEYLKEMNLSTSERLQNLNNIMVENHIPSGKGPFNSVLSFTPKILIFQNFKPNDKIVAKFSVKNISSTSTFLNMVVKESSYFFIKPTIGQLLSRLAPGISVTFAITFTPVQFEDYTHRVMFITDKDQYILPLIAMGPRPIIDFPDEIKISQTPLKIENCKIVKIHNVGMVPTSFTLSTKSPFSVRPKSMSLNPGQEADITVAFKTMYLGNAKGTLNAVFETGENFRINLHGSTHTVSIEMEKQIVRFFETYNTMVRQQTFKITNDSQHLLTYVCMKNDCVRKDFDEKLKLAKMLFNLKENESSKYKKLEHYDVLSSEEHERVYMRIFMDEIQALVADDSLHFQNTHFSVTPIMGELWPKKSTEITITFAPKSIGDFEATAYFDIDGVLDRVPLRMTGTSLPPSISLNLEILDMDRVYVNETYHYEIVAINKGHINGVVVYKETPMLFGSHITCTPKSLCLKPGEKELFVISYCNSNSGSYFEEVNFMIRDTNVVLKLYLKGIVQFPSLSFNTQCLDFGNVSLGVPSSLEFDVINESTCRIEVTLKVAADGGELSSIKLEDYAEAGTSKPAPPKWPKEFTIEPNEISLDSECRKTVNVTLVANIIREAETSLCLEIKHTDSQAVMLPIKFNARVPEIQQQPDLEIPLCFLGHVYSKEIHITGNGYWGYFKFEDDEESQLKVDFKVKEGFIEPNKSVSVPIDITTNVHGDQSFSIRLHLFGLSQKILLCEIKVCGSRPVITCFPPALHWGQIKLLNYIQKTLTLSNDSPITLAFKAHVSNGDENFRIEPCEGIIMADSEIEMVIEVYLVNPGTFTDKVIIQIDDAKDIVIPLSASGTGTSILVGDLKDRIELGLHFTKVPLKCNVSVENCGSRTTLIEWFSVPKAYGNKKSNPTFFDLEPRCCKILAKEKVELVITGFSSKVTTVNETWYLFGSVEGLNNKKELLTECPISAEFVDPKLEISAPLEGFEFWYNYGPYSEDCKLTDIVTIKNISKLPVTLDINVKQPFAIIKKQTYKVPPQEKNICCCTKYVRSDINVQQLMRDFGPKISKTFIDYLTLQPVEPRKKPHKFFEDIRKIKAAFNITHTVEECLDHEEEMQLHLLLDTTKHGSMRSKVYGDLMKIKYKVSPDKESVKLKGMIHFPNVLITSPKIDFQCILNNSVERKKFQIQNDTPLHVSYQFIWRKCTITIPKEEPTSISASEFEHIAQVKQATTDEVIEVAPSTDTTDLNLIRSIQGNSKELIIKEADNEAVDIKFPTNNELEECFKDRVIKAVAPMLETEYDSQMKWCRKLPKINNIHKVNLNDVISVTPHRGSLNKNETQSVDVTFAPKQNIIVNAVLECQVLGGPSELVLVTGQSSSLKYKISSKKINFKIRSFTANATEVLHITNYNKLCFQYRTYLNEPNFTNILEGTILSIDPPEKIIAMNEECGIHIVVRPGVLGYFNRRFLLQVGHCPHETIEVSGWGMIPQVYLSTKKHDLSDFSEDLGYLAIMTLTTEYLDAVNEMFLNRRPKSQHLNTPLTEACFDDPSLKKDWHICSSWDLYPSVIDIEMAIERYLVTEHLRVHPDILSQLLSSKVKHIPGFRSMPCEIDFGVIMSGSTKVRQHVDVINYGPLPIKIYLSKTTKFPPWLELKMCGTLLPGETKKMEVVFKPNPGFVPETEQTFETNFNLQVPYGVSIPVTVRALYAVPYLVTTVSFINFGEVKCGNKVVCSIPLKNTGKPTCVWYVTLKLKVPGAQCITIEDTSGKYDPEEGGWLTLTFKPTMDMVYEGTLIFRFHMNPKRMTIPVKGIGTSPRVHIIGPEIVFPPTLPWAKPISIYFGITNPCSFPIELVFVHSDKKFDEEQHLYEILSKYYDYPEEMVVPVMTPGVPLPEPIREFHKNMVDYAKRMMAHDAKVLKSKRLKSPKGQIATAKRARTQSEIAEDALQAMKNANTDPLAECLVPVDQDTEPEPPKRKGLMIFFHGAPDQEEPCKEIAYAVGLRLGLPTINIDNTIVDALCTSQSEAKKTIVTSINEMYENLLKQTVENTDEDNEDEEYVDPEDVFSTLWMKIKLLSKRGAGTKKNNNIKKSISTNVSAVSMGTSRASTMLNMDSLVEILEEELNQTRFDRGFVLDTLTSIFIKGASVLLATVLKCKCSIKNIHLVLCHSDINKWVHALEEAQKKESEQSQPKVYDETEIKNIIKQFDEMSPEEYEAASPEMKAIYLEYGLEERRKKYIQKKTRSQSGSLEKQMHKSSYFRDGNSENLRKGGKSGISLHRKSTTESVAESKKKTGKKDDAKAGKQSAEYLAMNLKFNEYNKHTYEALVTIANNWNVEECELCYPLSGIYGKMLGAKKSRLKSDMVSSMIGGSISNPDKGFPLTIVTNHCHKYKIALVNMFRSSSVVKEAFEDDLAEDILKRNMERKEFTVLLPKTMPFIKQEECLQWRFLNEPVIKKCECNHQINFKVLDDSNLENIQNILSTWHCTCGKKVISAQTSTSELLPSAAFEKLITAARDPDDDTPLSLTRVKSLSSLDSRLILEPGDLIRCKYTFSPKEEGYYNVKRFVEVNGWPGSRVTINAFGVCDLPKIDSRPKKIFHDFARRTRDNVTYRHTFLDDRKIFEFGPIFTGPNRIYEEKYTISLRNASLMTAEVSIQFKDTAATVFETDKKYVTLEKGGRDNVSLLAAPAQMGEYSNVLLLSIKNNPEIVALTIACCGVVPRVQILPLHKSIDFGKLLLYRRHDDRFIVKNDSTQPIKWVIRNSQDFAKNFILDQISGIVNTNDNQVVPVVYIACEVGIISNKTLIIDIYDAYGRGSPMKVETLNFSAECYDVQVECGYENLNENFLNFENVKVNSCVARDMYLLNRGKYSICFKLEKVKDFPEPSLLKSFGVTQTTGVLTPSLKIVPISFQCTPTTAVNLVNVPAYTCTLLDGSKDQVIVAKFPICITIASFYNTFTLYPLRELNFNIIAVGNGVVRDVILENTSKCPFTYQIILPVQYRTLEDPTIPTSTPSIGKGKDKLKYPPLKCGNFIISNDDNLLAPGATKTIPIQFLATAPRKFEESIHFLISDTHPTEGGQGVPLRLVGLGAMPSLDLWNIETTFREHHIVKSLSEYQVPEVTPHCVFSEDTETLHFYSVIVQNNYTATIDLYNDGVVPSVVNMALKYHSNSNADIFSLDKYEATIEPLGHQNLKIIFTPKALQEYRAILEINLKLYENKSQTFTICLIGEGNIPRIAILEPNMKHSKYEVLNLPLTFVGSISKKIIKFQNISSVISQVELNLEENLSDSKLIFWLTADQNKAKQLNSVSINNHDQRNCSLKVTTKPNEIFIIHVNYNPSKKGRDSCNVNFKIEENPFEMYTVNCEAEAFLEDVILLGLEAVSSEVDENATTVSTLTIDSKKRGKKSAKEKKKTKTSNTFAKQSGSSVSEPHLLKYHLDFGGCQLNTLQKRSVIMVNNSKKVYKFSWNATEYVVLKPSVGYISPAEEKDLEVMFISSHPNDLKKETVTCKLLLISDESLTIDTKGSTWDSRKCITVFDHNRDTSLNERREEILNDQWAFETGHGLNIAIMYTAKTEYTSYKCSLPDRVAFNDTFIYQKKSFEFTVKNTGNVAMKISWNFSIDEEYPAVLDKKKEVDRSTGTCDGTSIQDETEENKSRHSTLFSGSEERTSVDTWFEVQLPFTVEPANECIPQHTTQIFKIIFAPLDAFDYKVRLKSNIDNLATLDQNISCEILAKSLIPYCHLDVEESDYLSAGRRKVVGGLALPSHITVMEFNVLGSGCYKKIMKLINPTNEGYEFVLEKVISENSDLVPIQCDKWNGFLEGGTSIGVTFTFAPTDPGVYETQWKCFIPVHSLTLYLLVVGIVKEPQLEFIPTILWIKNSLVGFPKTESVMLKNREAKTLRFEFKGNSLCGESGKTPVIVEPNEGVLQPCSELPIKIMYTPEKDGPLTFKIYCSVTHLVKPLTLVVNALSFWIKPKVTYSFYGNEHVLNSEVVTNIHLDQTASTHERKIIFKIANEGSAAFFFDWQYNTASVKKYLQVDVTPNNGHISPGIEKDCILHFILRKVIVHAFPITLSIRDGPNYNINLHAMIMKPLYCFSCKEINFEKCIVNAPEDTYKKRIRFTNNDVKPVTLEINFVNLPELYVHIHATSININPEEHVNIPFYFRPKDLKEYEFKVPFFVNSLCEETITVRGEGVPLVFDLYEGCNKSYDLGQVKVGEKVVKEIEVMNYSQVPIVATFSFRDMNIADEEIVASSDATSLCFPPDMGDSILVKQNPGLTRTQTLKEYKDNKTKEKREKVIEKASASLKIIPDKVSIKQHGRAPIKIQFKPVGLINDLRAQLNMKVFNVERPLVLLKGCATGMSLSLSQDSLEFGNIRRRGRKVMKILLMNKGDFGTRFWWGPIKSDEYTISPMKGYIMARTNVTFTVSCKPLRNSPFIKDYLSCYFENHKPLELIVNATCVDSGTVQNITIHFAAPVRGCTTEYVTVTNPTDQTWLINSEISHVSCFETLKEFKIEPNSTFTIPIHFKPKFVGPVQGKVLFSPLGDQSLFLHLEGNAKHPDPNGTIDISVMAQHHHTEELKVYHTTPELETYVVYSEVMKTSPDKLDALYELKHPETIKVWGDTYATCRWTFICFTECVMNIKVIFINEVTKEYQYYYINVAVRKSDVVDTITLTSRARETVQKEILVENKLLLDSDFDISCGSDTVGHPDKITIKRNSKKPLTVTYSPLVVGVTEELLEVRHSMVESYLYKLILKCLPANEKKVEISTPLGTSTPLRLRVRNYTDGRADFISTISHPSIMAEKEYILAPSEKGKFLVWFEPTQLGKQRSKVTFNSPIAGEFVFDVMGMATIPKPQGPILIKVGGNTNVWFKNVFTETRTFKMSVDRKEFYLKTQNEQIKSKKEIKIPVYMVQSSALSLTDEMPTGSLIIECVDPPEPDIQWIYFLQGII